jgi:hypothetical protein
MAGVQFPEGTRDFSLLKSIQTCSGALQSLIQWVLGALSPRIKQVVCEADRSHPSSAKVKNGGAISPLPPICLHGKVLNSLNTGTISLT